MKILVDGRQMKQCDKNTIEHFRIPSLVLMERAALGTVEEIISCFPGKEQVSALVVCGYGNNGGDGLAIGRMLLQKGYDVTVVMPEEGHPSEETAVQMEILCAYGIAVEHKLPEREFDVVVDALFGIGLSRNPEGIYREYLTAMNGLQGLKIAVDIPSGVHADTGTVMGTAFRADKTVTFAFAKPGLLLYPGAGCAGTVLVKDIGIGKESFLEEKPSLYCMEEKDLARLPRRRPDSNKGSYGKVLTVAGCKNMAGAAFFSAKAAYVTGAGLVRMFTEESNRIILQQLLPEAILTTYEGTKFLAELLPEVLHWPSVIVAGPGLGTGKTARKLVKLVLKYAEVPVILDADGLNLTAEHPEWLKLAKAPVIVTPHPGEMARLTGKSISDIQKQLLQTARDFAGEYHVICVLKDARTITTLSDGTTWINTSGNNGMATAGSGDVLTGILAGLIAQGMTAQKAAALGVYLHGAGADRQVAETGVRAMMAQDIIEGTAAVLREYDARPAGGTSSGIQTE
ncbi:NAD(P)H-hydrate dehydratase [Lachnospiraceae bacterium KK002]